MTGLLKRSHEIDMCSEPLTKKMLLFVVPIMLSTLLQCLFNLADSVVVGRFSAEGNDALAAVGTCGVVSNILLNLAIGLGVGVNVFTARSYGAKDYDRLSDGVHTSMALSLIVGALFSVLGVVLTPLLLDFVAVPADIRPLSYRYMSVCFAGYIFTAVYNFGSAILRAVGDTTRPLIYMAVAGVLNLLLNLVFVIFFEMSVTGVALATVLSQGVAAVLTVLTLLRTEGCYRLSVKGLRLNGPALKKIIGVGIPAGVQSTLFALANTLGQSAVNSFGKVVMAAHAASNNVQGIIHTPMSTLDQATLAFTSQNLGAKRIDNIRKVERKSVLINAVSSLIIALIAFTIGGTLLKIYNVDSEEMMQAALTHMHIVTATAGLGTLMCVYAALMRGIGYSVKPTVVTLIGSCLLRVLWILFILPLNHKLGFLYIVYPITWIVTTAVHFVCFRRGLRKTERRLAAGDDI